MTRTDAILEYVRVAVEARRAEFDRATDLRAVEVFLLFAPGHLAPREAVVRPEYRASRDKKACIYGTNSTK